MICTTLNKIREHGPCEDGWRKLLKYLGKTEADDDPLPLLTILESNGLDDALWCTRSAPKHDREWRLFAVWCARQVQHLMKDPRSINALDIAEKYANGLASKDELDAARAARAAARSAARSAAEAAGDAAWEAAGAVAWFAAWDAAGAAAAAAARSAAEAAGDAAWEAAGADAGDAARDKQEEEFRRIIS